MKLNYKFLVVLGILAIGTRALLRLGAEEIEFEHKVILIESGDVIEGQIRDNGTNFEIRQPSGIVVIPYSQAVHLANDKIGIFTYLESRLPTNKTTRELVDLAAWCVRQKLLDQAVSLLKEAEELEPESVEIRGYRRKLEDRIELKKRAIEEPPVSRVSQMNKKQGEQEPLKGLNKETTTIFIREVQPILATNCIASGCHGPRSETKLRLTPVPRGQGNMRKIHEQNLAQILEFLDEQSPSESPLLTIPKANHGRPGRRPFSGRAGEVQFQNLKKWVLKITENGLPQKEKSSDPLQEEEKSEEYPEQPLPDPRVQDPFDPAVFNRLYHP